MKNRLLLLLLVAHLCALSAFAREELATRVTCSDPGEYPAWQTAILPSATGDLTAILVRRNASGRMVKMYEHEVKRINDLNALNTGRSSASNLRGVYISEDGDYQLNLFEKGAHLNGLVRLGLRESPLCTQLGCLLECESDSILEFDSN